MGTPTAGPWAARLREASAALLSSATWGRKPLDNVPPTTVGHGGQNGPRLDRPGDGSTLPPPTPPKSARRFDPGTGFGYDGGAPARDVPAGAGHNHISIQAAEVPDAPDGRAERRSR